MSESELKTRTRRAMGELIDRILGGLAPAHSASPARALDLSELEERILLSASPAMAVAEMADAAMADSMTVETATAENEGVTPSQSDSSSSSNQQSNSNVSIDPSQNVSHEIVFLDTSVEDYQQLLDDLWNNDDPSREIEVVLLSSSRDGINQISEALKERRDLDAVHIVSHGTNAAVKLGSTWLTQDNLAGYVGEIARWGTSLSPDADLLFYGCDLAGSSGGQNLIDSLATLTGADIAASNNDTGHAIFGADWDLEYELGDIESIVAFNSSAQAEWIGTLDASMLEDTTSAYSDESTDKSGADDEIIENENDEQVEYLSPPLAFEQNLGQTDDAVDFLARGSGYTVFLSDGDAVLSVTDGDTDYAVRLHLEGGDSAATTVAQNELVSRSNYLVGDSSEWQTDVANFGKVRYGDVYEGIDVAYYGNQRQLEYDFIVDAGADAGQIKLKFDGAEAVYVDGNGELVIVLSVKGDEIRFHAPYSYQETESGRQTVVSRYRINADGTVGFELGDYDASRELVIDPILDYSTFVGGTGNDQANAIGVDASGDVYIAGLTGSAVFPTTTGVLDESFNGSFDAFVTKLSADGTSVVYSTYFGGSGQDEAEDLFVTSTGEVYITGETRSGDLPTTAGVVDTSLGGTNDGFVAKLNAAGDTLLYSTYLGGSNLDVGKGITVDSTGNAYIAGYTGSSDFPVTGGAHDTSLSGTRDAFVAKLNSTATSITYATYYGGSGSDEGLDIAIDSSDRVHVVGRTFSTNLSTNNAFDSSANGNEDGYFIVLSADGSTLDYGTYLGGSSDDEVLAIDVDSSDSAYLTGTTASSAFPTTEGAYDTSHNGDQDVFVMKFDASQNLDYSTFLGEAGHQRPRDIAVDSIGRAWVVGEASNSTIPVTGDAYQSGNDGIDNAFIAQFDATGATLEYATHIGGTNRDEATSVAIDSSDNVYVTGHADSSDFDTTSGAYDETHNGSTDAWVAKFFTTVPSPADWEFRRQLTFNNLSQTENLADFPVLIALDATRIDYSETQNDGEDLRFYDSDNTTLLAHEIEEWNESGTSYVWVRIPQIDGSSNTDFIWMYYGNDGASDGQDAANVWSAGYQGVWHLDETGAVTREDATSNSNDGTPMGVTNDASGQVSAADSFNGSDLIDVGSPLSLDITGDITVSAWVKVDGGSGTQRPIVGKGDTQYMLRAGDENDFEFFTHDGSFHEVNANGTFTQDQWYYVTGRVDGTEVSLWVDGVKQTQTRTGGISSNSEDVEIGRNSQVTSRDFHGTIDEVRISNVARSADWIAAQYGSTTDNFVTFGIEQHITATIDYATFLGGSGSETVSEIAVHSSGDVFVVGRTLSGDLPATVGALDTSFSGASDLYVARLTPDGNGSADLVYLTYLGGSDDEFEGSIEVDAAGNAYVAGATQSTDLPTTGGAYDSTLGGTQDSFVVKINPTGDTLLYGTYFGGDGGAESGPDLELDALGRVHISGQTHSSDLPLVNAFDTVRNGSDSYIARLSASGTTLEYSTFIGGSQNDGGGNITVDSSGLIYFANYTISSDFQTTAGAYQTSLNGTQDAVLSVIDPSLSGAATLVYSTYFGGSGDEGFSHVVVDSTGDVYLMAATDSSDLPTTAGAYDTTFAGADDLAIVKFDPAGNGSNDLLYSTYIGGAGDEDAGSIELDSNGDLYFTGTAESGFTTVNAVQPNHGGGTDDAVVGLISPDGNGTNDLLFATYLGGSGEDKGRDLAVDSSNTVHVVGFTDSTDYSTTSGAYDTSANGSNDNFISIISGASSALVTAENDAPVLAGANNLASIVEDDVTNSGTLVSALISGQVTDADSGAQTGIVVVGVDNTNGIWEYTTNSGGLWQAFGTPSESAAHLLTSDANTRVRFVPDADWNGTVTNGITFYAWDQTSGTAGSTADLTSTDTLRDEFNAVSYSNSDGTANWTSDWVEFGDDGLAPSGNMRVEAGELFLFQSVGVDRAFDLAGSSSATLTFDYSGYAFSGTDNFATYVSNDGGSNWVLLEEISFVSSPGENFSGNRSFELASYVALTSNMEVRFQITSGFAGPDQHVNFDNIQVEYATGGGTGGTTAFSTASASASVTVTADNDAPTINALGNQTIAEDGTTGALALSVSDVETAAGSLTVTASSSNTTIIPNGNLTLVDLGSGNWTIEAAPALNQNGGPVTITVTVDDGTTTTDETFDVTVTAENDAPTISALGNQTIAEDGTTGALAFSVSDVETAAGSLTVTASSSNTTIIPNGNLTLVDLGSGNWTIEAAPALNQNGGPVTITVTVDDGTTTTDETVDVTVTADNDAPTISAIGNQTIAEDGTTGALAFSVSDVETAAGSLTVTASSSNTTIIPNGNLTLVDLGSGNWTIEASPALNQNGGPVTITVTVDDGTTTTDETFDVTVTADNDAPTISALGNQTIAEDGTTGALAFSVSDVETAAGSLTVTASSSNTTIIPNGNLTLVDLGSGNWTIEASPALNQNGGPVTITVTVDDGTTTTDETFDVTVTAVNDAPVGVVASNFTAINEDDFTSAGKLVSDFTTTDVDLGSVEGIAVIDVDNTNGTWEYTLNGSDWFAIGNVSDGMARLLPSDATTRVRFVPDPDFNGVASPFTVVAWDQTSGVAGGLADASTRSGVTPFSLASATVGQTVTAVNDAPVITSDSGGATASVNVSENSTAVTTVTSSDVDGGTASYSITGGADSAEFSIVSGSGVLTFISAPDFESPTDVSANNVYEVTVEVSDGNGGTDSQDISVTVDNLNATPTNSVPGDQTVVEDATLTFNSANSNLISISAEGDEVVTVSLSVNDGTLSLSQTTGLTFTNGDGTDDAAISFSGTISNINSAIDGLEYTPNADFNGSDSLKLVSTDAATIALDSDANLLGYYEFTSPTPGADSSPVGTNTATLQGDATIVTDATTSGDALSLDGSGDYAQITGEFGQPADLTLAAWVNGTAGYGDIFSIQNRVILRFDDINGSTGVSAIYHDGTTYQKAGSGQFLEDTGWHHVAMTFSDASKTLTLYIDGVQAAQDTFTASISYLGGNTFIGSNKGESLFFEGLIDEARVFDRALSGGEISTLAASAVYLSDSDTLTINVDPGNDVPTITLPGTTVDYTENDPATIIDATATISDVDSANFDGGEVRVGFAGGTGRDGDTLSIRNQGTGSGQIGVTGSTVSYEGTDIGTFTGGTSSTPLVVSLNSNATPAAVQALARNVTFENTSDNPSETTRTVRFDALDGDGGDAMNVDTTVDVTAENDAPTITSNGGGVSAAIDIEDGSTTVTTITSSDPDGGTASYSINGGADSTSFNIDSVSGALMLKTAADFASPADATGDGVYEVTVTVSDGAGGTDSQSIQATIVAPDVRLIYGQSNDATPQFREFDTIRDILSGEATTTEAGSTIRWSTSVLSPDGTEELVVILSDTGSATELNLLRWDGESWTVDWTATDITSANSNKQGFSIAYETSSGHAVVVYSNNTAAPVYRTWDGSSWSAEADVFATAPGSGTVLWVELASSPISDEITLVYSDSAELQTVVWDGSAWNEAATENTLETTLAGAGNSRAFDVAYESSGDVVIAWGDGSDVDFETRAAGTTTWIDGVQFPVVSGIITFVGLAADPTSDRIAFAGIDDNAGAARLGLMTWDGSAWQDIGEYDNGFPHVLTDGFGEFWAGVGWAGTTAEAVAVYSDADSGVLNWASWTVDSGWTIESDFSVTGAGILRSVELADYGNDGVATIFSDENGSLWGLTYEGGSWTILNGGAALETTVSDLKTKPFSLSVERFGGNDASIVDLNGSDTDGTSFSTSFTEGGGRVSITDTDATVSDIDHATYQALNVNLAGFDDGSDEEVRINNEQFDFGVANVVTTMVGGTLFNLDFDGSGFSIDNDAGGVIPESDLQALLRLFEYENQSLNPTAGNRTFGSRATDAGGLASTLSVSTISVSGVNNRPTLTAFADSVDTTLEDTEVEITFAKIAAQGNESDADGTVTAFVVKSVPTGSLKIGLTVDTATAYSTGSNNVIDATRNAYWTPSLNSNGTNNAFTVVARDNLDLESIGNIAVPVEVTPVNDDPTISAIADQTPNEDTATGAIAFTVGDVETAAGSLTVTATSGNQTLVPDGNITLGGSGASRTINVLPGTNENGGPATITVSVFDGDATTQTTFDVTVSADNDAPVASISQSGYGVNEDDPQRILTGVSVSDLDAGSNDVSVTVSVDDGDLTVTTTTGLTFTAGTNGSSTFTAEGTISELNAALGTLRYQPDANFNGTDTFTLFVDDLGNSGGGGR